jgi:hypothetical protein
MLEWNIPERVAEEETVYSHYLVIFLELQNEHSEPIKYDSVKIRLASTSRMLNLRERIDMSFGGEVSDMEARHVESLINQAVRDAKLKYAGFTYDDGA